jgi:hypothetical protein
VGFKEDADFARFVSMGATGTAAIASYLRDRYGHRPIELERYAMANKIWQTKVKRLRLPDLLCAACGRRVESRAKSALAIVLSDSDTPGREWYAGGMRDDDLYAFIRADLSTFPPPVGQPVFFSSAALHYAFPYAKRTSRKAASQGAEVTLAWPSWVPGKSGWFRGVDEQDRIVCEFDDGGRRAYWQWRNWPIRRTYLEVGARIEAGDTMVAGVVEPPGPLTCPGAEWDVETDLQAEDPTTVYAAVKAAGILADERLLGALVTIAQRDSVDWRVRLEAHASLARLDPTAWTKPIGALALDPRRPDEQRMEAVFVLSEIPTNEAASALAEVARFGDHGASELRAAAVWGLGRGVHPRPDLLLPFTVDPVDLVGLHAIVALQGIPTELLPTLLDWLQADDRRAATAAALLARHEEVATLLTAVGVGGRARLWALQALGRLRPEVVHAKASERLTEAADRELQTLWIAHDDWLLGATQEGLEALAVQTVRFDPLQPG